MQNCLVECSCVEVQTESSPEAHYGKYYDCVSLWASSEISPNCRDDDNALWIRNKHDSSLQVGLNQIKTVSAAAAAAYPLPVVGSFLRLRSWRQGDSPFDRKFCRLRGVNVNLEIAIFSQAFNLGTTLCRRSIFQRHESMSTSYVCSS